MKKIIFILFIGLIATFKGFGQGVGASPEYIKGLTADWKGERFEDGRPKISDDLLERLKKLTLEEVWAELIDLGYLSQFEGDWQLINDKEETTMVGRAVTAQFVPTRPDLDKYIRVLGKKEGRDYERSTTSWAISTLVKGDIYVADGYGKPAYGTLIGSNLGNGVFSRTGKGVVFYGNVRDMEDLRKIKGFNGWIKGSDPSYMRQTMLMSINYPIRMGKAIVLPGDAVLAKKDGVLFVPSHLVEDIIVKGEMTKLYDVFGQIRIKEKKYTAGEIDSKWTTEIKADFRNWVKSYEGKLPLNKEDLDKYLQIRNY
jgi:regulator of RNase E activity RraA